MKLLSSAVLFLGAAAGQVVSASNIFQAVEEKDETSRSWIVYAPLRCNVDAVPAIESDECMGSAIALSYLVESAAAAAAEYEADAAAILAASSLDSANITTTNETSFLSPPPPPVTVPCGTCAFVDYADGSIVTIPGGLDVVGRLHFPPEANVTLNTTAVIVQGVLGIDVRAEGAKVKITLYGTENQFFYPHEECPLSPSMGTDLGAGVFRERPDCIKKSSVGKKPIVVAGGKVDIRAIDPTCPSWTTLRDVGKITEGTNAFFVDPAFVRCIRPGDDLLVTSDTKFGWEDHLVRTVQSVNVSAGVIAIEGHTTREFATEAGPGEAEFAAEVANLSRDVVFEAQRDDPDGAVGGHFMIYHTPDVVQTISGVLFENFGQAGNLGRYPVHFHICDTSPSVVSMNVIRNSNQRCVVIHHTDDVTIDDNVAYNTSGHCFTLETGTERFNTFRRNLGARTDLLSASNGQSDSPGFDGKHQAATFWIRNMENSFIGNVAAGSRSSGWWIEMKDLRGNQLSPSSFRDNVAHSSSQGVNTYKKGWQPANGGVLDSFRIYKNNEGMKFHISGNFTVNNSLIADNGIGVRYGVWNKVVTLENTLFKGLSEDARIRLHKSCPITSSGIHASFNNWLEKKSQIRLKNVTFTDFTCDSKTISYYLDTRQSNDDMGDPLQAMDVSIVDSAESAKPYFGCGTGDGAKNLFIEDINGTLGPDGEGPGFIVWNSERMKAFLPPDRCGPMPYSGSLSTGGGTCNVFCVDVCLRQVSITPSGDGHNKLILQNGVTSYTFLADQYESFVLVLPPDEYYGRFLDFNDNEIIAPSVSIEAYTPPLCDNFVTSSSFVFQTNVSSSVPTNISSSVPTGAPSAVSSVQSSDTGTEMPSPFVSETTMPSSVPSAAPSVSGAQAFRHCRDSSSVMLATLLQTVILCMTFQRIIL